MSLTLLHPLLGLDQEFPDQLFVLHHPPTDRYGCFQHQQIHGLACFSSEGGAISFSQQIDLAGMVTRTITFDEAREIAKGRPMPVVSVMLLDQLDNPHIHFVR